MPVAIPMGEIGTFKNPVNNCVATATMSVPIIHSVLKRLVIFLVMKRYVMLTFMSQKGAGNRDEGMAEIVQNI